MAAFALTAAADRTGDPVLIEEVGIAVRNAIFEQGLDIGQTEVIDVIAARFGLVPLDAEATSEAVNADLGRGA
jgi:predicted DsbA family dithiol-disulfide isomerase